VRRRLFEERLDWVVPENEARRYGLRCTCPCCGYPTLLDRYSYEICELCDWEDDGQDDDDADKVLGGPNGRYSLTEARKNFARHLRMYDPRDFRGNEFAEDSPAQVRAKREMMAAFDDMTKKTDQPDTGTLVRCMNDGEKTLADELDRKVREYEARDRGRKST